MSEVVKQWIVRMAGLKRTILPRPEGVLYLETRSAATKTMTSWLEDNNANERHSKPSRF